MDRASCPQARAAPSVASLPEPAVVAAAGGTEPPQPTVARWLGSRRAPWALALAGGLLAVVVNRVIYPGFSWNRDEVVYLWHADVLRAGHLAIDDDGFPRLFQPWLSGHRDGRLFSQYTLGWPLVLMVGRVLGSASLCLVAVTAALPVAVHRFVRLVTGRAELATLTGALVLASPVIVLQAGTYLNYLFALTLGLAFAHAFVSGVTTASRRQVALAGLLVGWLFMTRPFDAGLWGLVALGFVAYRERSRWRRRLALVPAFVAGVAPVVAVALVTNAALTGSPTRFPMTVADPMDTYGLGTRRLMPGFEPVTYGWHLAAESTLKNTYHTPWFLAGAHLSVLLAMFGTWRARREPSTWFLVALGMAFPLGYFAFFGTHVSSLTASLVGPIYYIPAYVALCALAAIGLAELWSRRRTLARTALVAVAVVSVAITMNRAVVNRRLSVQDRAWSTSVADLEGPALVVVAPAAYLGFLNPYSLEEAGLDPRIEYATERGPEVVDLVASRPGVQAYRQQSALHPDELLPSDHPRHNRVSLTPLELVEGPHLDLSVTVGGLAAGDRAALRLRTPTGTLTAVADATAPRTTWRIRPGVGSPDRLAPGLAQLRVDVRIETADGTRRAYRLGHYVRAGRHRLRALDPAVVERAERSDRGGPRWRGLTPGEDATVTAELR